MFITAQQYLRRLDDVVFSTPVKLMWKGRIISIETLLIKVLVFFLPFTNTLVIKVGFPLKISEICLFAILGIKILDKSLKIDFWLLLLFLWTLISLFINEIWTFTYSLLEYPPRISHFIDSLLKLFYVALAFLTFSIIRHHDDSNRLIDIFLYGAVFASFYGIYIAFGKSLLPSLPVLPGHVDFQYIRVVDLLLIRNGPFKEGNYFGCFLVLCFVLASHRKNRTQLYIFYVAIISTFSTIALILVHVLLVWHFIKSNIHWSFKFATFSLGFLLISGVYIKSRESNPIIIVVEKLVIEKLFSKEDNPLSYSRFDRLNSSWVGIEIFKNNLLFGVGINNYGRHYNEFNEEEKLVSDNLKFIPNNVYVEILAEGGVLAFIFFVFFLIQTHIKIIHKKFMIPLLIYFNVFPTFTLLFIWVFLGLIVKQYSKVS